MNRHEPPSSPAAPLRENDIGLLPPEEDDDRPQLPTVRILGMKLSTLLIVAVVIGAFFFGVRAFINYSTSEVSRANDEVHKAFAR